VRGGGLQPHLAQFHNHGSIGVLQGCRMPHMYELCPLPSSFLPTDVG
jgi:hypothetical protein